MEVTIYVDVLFVINLFINYFLLLLSARLSFMKINRFRIILSSSFGAIYSCVIFFCDLNSPILFFTKIISALIMVHIAFLPKTKRDVLRTSIIFLISNLFLGGICYALYYFFSPLNMTFRNTVVYFNISPALLILITILTYLIIILFENILKPKNLNIGEDYLVNIYYNNKNCTLNGFIDTGNKLTDFFTNTPVVVCSYYSIEKILNNEEKHVFKNFSSIDDISLYIEKIRIIPVNTVSSGAFLPAFIPEKVILTNSKKSFEIKHILIAVSNESSLKNEPIILNPELIYE